MGYAVKENRKVRAWQLGAGSEMERDMIRRGKIAFRPDGTYEVFSQEAREGTGQVVKAGDYFKVDDKGFPYPNEQSFFEENHEHTEGDWYLQKSRILKFWRKDDPECEEVRFLLERGLLGIRPEDPSRYFFADMWGTRETAPSDAVIAFYAVEREPDGRIASVEFNFIVRDYFEKYYRVLPS